MVELRALPEGWGGASIWPNRIACDGTAEAHGPALQNFKILGYNCIQQRVKGPKNLQARPPGLTRDSNRLSSPVEILHAELNPSCAGIV
jgi:hypothetical protein